MLSLAVITIAFTAFRSGEPWLDTSGNVIDAHGGGMLIDNGVYYWYGSQRSGHPCEGSCHDGGIDLAGGLRIL